MLAKVITTQILIVAVEIIIVVIYNYFITNVLSLLTVTGIQMYSCQFLYMCCLYGARNTEERGSSVLECFGTWNVLRTYKWNKWHFAGHAQPATLAGRNDHHTHTHSCLIVSRFSHCKTYLTESSSLCQPAHQCPECKRGGLKDLYKNMWKAYV